MLSLIVCLFSQRLFPKGSAYAKTIPRASLRVPDYPRRAFPSVWEHRWFGYSVLIRGKPGPCPVQGRESPGSSEAQKPTLHLSGSGRPGSLLSHHNSRWEGFAQRPVLLPRSRPLFLQFGARKSGQTKLCIRKLSISLADHLHGLLGSFRLKQTISTSVSRVFCWTLILKDVKWFYEKGESSTSL